MDRQTLLSLYGEFIFSFSDKFLIQTESGNFIWSDPDYNGDNTIHPYMGSVKDFVSEHCYGIGRYKGCHNIGRYCGENIIFHQS